MNQFLIRPKVISGAGALSAIGLEAEKFQARKVLIITDPGVKALGLADRVGDALAAEQIEYRIFDQVEADPSIQTAEKAAVLATAEQVDLIVAVGGGGPIDAAKAAAVLVTNGGNLKDYKGVDKFHEEPLPLFAIPTTAGTGSEMTGFAVMSDLSSSEKFPVNGTRLIPRLAILDPELILTLPAGLTATTGMDALGHAIESYTSLAAQPATEALAIKAIQMIFENLKVSVYRGDNLTVRENMLQASMLAGAAFNVTFLGVCHALAPCIGGLYHIPHGLAVAALLPHCMRYNLPACTDKYAQIALTIGVGEKSEQKISLARKAIDAVQDLCDEFRIPTHLQELGVKEEDFDYIADFVVPHLQVKNNPRIPTHKDIVELCRKMY